MHGKKVLGEPSPALTARAGVSRLSTLGSVRMRSSPVVLSTGSHGC